MPAAGLEPAKPPIGLAGGLVSGVGVHLLQLLAGLDQRQGLAAVGDGAVHAEGGVEEEVLVHRHLLAKK